MARNYTRVCFRAGFALDGPVDGPQVAPADSRRHRLHKHLPRSGCGNRNRAYFALSAAWEIHACLGKKSLAGMNKEKRCGRPFMFFGMLSKTTMMMSFLELFGILVGVGESEVGPVLIGEGQPLSISGSGRSELLAPKAFIAHGSCR